MDFTHESSYLTAESILNIEEMRVDYSVNQIGGFIIFRMMFESGFYLILFLRYVLTMYSPGWPRTHNLSTS